MLASNRGSLVVRLLDADIAIGGVRLSGVVVVVDPRRISGQIGISRDGRHVADITRTRPTLAGMDAAGALDVPCPIRRINFSRPQTIKEKGPQDECCYRPRR